MGFGEQWGKSKEMHLMDQHCIQEGVVMLLITLCQGNLDKLWLGWPLGLSTDLTLHSIFFFNLTYYEYINTMTLDRY